MSSLIVLLLIGLVCVSSALISTNSLVSFGSSAGKSISFDGRSFIIDNQRVLFIAGSVHYPRLPQSEWGQVFQQLKDSGINLIQTYVFWDIHEPTQGQYYFPDDNSPDNVVKFIQTAKVFGLYVNLRIGPYVCAEWSSGGLPVWLRSLKQMGNPDKTIVYRTDDTQWLDAMLSFSDKVIDVMNEAKLFYADGGPIVMLQLENEYGNIQAAYGQSAINYIAILTDYMRNKQSAIKNLPWIMCQQGEGVGTAPPADIINTCNGYYCDNWISQHAKDFPNQPHMFTENWPGWFQKYGEPVPHRPAVDVAFSVARWFAKGGDYMNYYMAFGGSTFGRHVGGPLIVTSYDYDVQVNEYAMKAEPKYSLLTRLHALLISNQHLLLNQPIADTVIVNNQNYCEQHTYTGNPAAGDQGCLIFLSNWDTTQTCSFPLNGNTYSVSPWSVSILTGLTCDAVQYVYSTRDTAKEISENAVVMASITDIPLQTGLCETIPAQVPLVMTTKHPMEQLSATNDTTDYLWYSTTIPPSTTDRNATLRFTVGVDGGSLVHVYVNGERIDAHLPTADMTSTNIQNKLSFTIALPKDQPTELSILSMTFGLTNYGANLEEMQAGIISEVRLDQKVLTNWKHSIGLKGESIQLSQGKEWIGPSKASRAEDAVCPSIRWLRGEFWTKDLPVEKDGSLAPLAVDPLSSGLTKGSIWVNGFMIGRYWNVIATGVCGECTSESYTGAYSAERCRTGCGQPSQQFYKVPRDVLYSKDSTTPNVVVVTDESGTMLASQEYSVTLSKVSMQTKAK